MSNYSEIAPARTLIDASKWTIVSTNEAVAKVTLSDVITIDSLTIQGANYWANYIYSVNSYTNYTVRFSANFVIRENDTPRITWGITNADKTNRVEFYKTTTGLRKVSFQIISSGSQVYTVETNTNDFGQFKIVTAGDNVKVYEWINDAWVQVGATQSYALGACAFYLASLGGGGKAIATISDVVFSATDFNTLFP